MTIMVRGIGWLSASGYGTLRTGTCHRYSEGEGLSALSRLGLFSQPFKNFGRLDAMSRMTASSAALALRDAEITYTAGIKQNIGIIGSSTEGSLASDSDYFNDYIENGRTLSRANLFIYTLPSSPMGEAAIHFGLTGPLMFVTGRCGVASETITMAADMITAREASAMLVIGVSGEDALCLLMDDQQHNACCSSEDVRAIVETTKEIPDILRQLSILKLKKGNA